MAEADFIKAFKEALADLRTPDKSHINTLTMLAEDNRNYARSIVEAVEKHLENCPTTARLPAMYLMDSIIKNVKEPYRTLFSKRLDQVFGKIYNSTLPEKRAPLDKLVKLWEGVLAADVLARVRSRMGGINGAAQVHVQAAVVSAPQPQQPGMGFQHMQRPVAVQQQQPVLQMAHPPQQQRPQVFHHPHVVAGVQPAPAHIVLPPGQQLPGIQLVSMQPAAQQPQALFVMGPNGHLVPVAQQQIIPAPMQQQPVPASAIPQHMLSGLPPVSPAHPNWQQQPQQQPVLPLRQMQPQQPQLLPAGAGPMVRRSPAYPASPAVVQASPHHTSTRSPHHRPSSSPAHHSAPTSGRRSGSPTSQAEQVTASLTFLLQGLTKGSYLNDPALKTTSFDPAFIKKEHKGVIELLKEASAATRAHFKDIQFQRNKRRKDAKQSSALLSRSWFLPVDSWVQATTVGGTAEEEAEAEEQASEDEGPPPVPTVPKDPSQTHCAVSREPFEELFDDASQAWVYKGVVRLEGPEAERYGVPDGSLVKVECLAEADLGSSPAGLAAAAAAAAGGGEDEADLAAAAVAAPAAGQAGAPAAAAATAQQNPQPAELAQVKVEQQDMAGGQADMQWDQADTAAAAAAAGIKQQHPDAAAVKPDITANGDGGGPDQQQQVAAGVKRDAGDGVQLEQEQGTPTKKPRLSS